MNSVRTAFASSRDFMLLSSLDPWEGICCASRDECTARYFTTFAASLAKRKKEVDKHMYNSIGQLLFLVGQLRLVQRVGLQRPHWCRPHLCQGLQLVYQCKVALRRQDVLKRLPIPL